MSRSYKLPARQRGDVLLESLIGILLMSTIGLGITYASSRAAVSQRDMKLQNIVVNQMRSLLEQNGALLCSKSSITISIPTQTDPLPITATCTSASAVTVGTSTITGGTPQSSVVLTTRSQDSSLFGGVIRVGDES
ncbi:hypothetical protein [Pseudomonas vanderleydeniana]|uniref:Uncharacterized protein n=1 Tax=Pseudomonas vanderleydeniana TaxID=2745495 RepID=A0A9E6PKI4_9PSED|nr:hypothetical protein [Pseudomonas vanderleydeniana]QXI27863.1 hypothetical protein HU752_028905 [Pseudomonas vanderleydeniana]